MGIIKGKWMLVSCDLQIVWDCQKSDEYTVPWSGKRAWESSMIKEFQKDGYLIYEDNFCICLKCAEAITIEDRK